MTQFHCGKALILAGNYCLSICLLSVIYLSVICCYKIQNFIDGLAPGMKSQSIASLLRGSEHIYWILGLEVQMHSTLDQVAFKNARTNLGSRKYKHLQECTSAVQNPIMHTIFNKRTFKSLMDMDMDTDSYSTFHFVQSDHHKLLGDITLSIHLLRRLPEQPLIWRIYSGDHYMAFGNMTSSFRSKH